MKKQSDDGYIIEYIELGGSMKVTAFDPRSLREVSIIAPPSTSRAELARLAIRKLHYVEKNKDTD